MLGGWGNQNRPFWDPKSEKTMPTSTLKFNRFLNRFSTIFWRKNPPKLKPKSPRNKENYRCRKIFEKSSKKRCKMSESSPSWKSKISQNAVTVVLKQGSAQPRWNEKGWRKSCRKHSNNIQKSTHNWTEIEQNIDTKPVSKKDVKNDAKQLPTITKKLIQN